MTAFLPHRPLLKVLTPWLSAALAMTATSLVAASVMALRPPSRAVSDQAMGAEIVIAFAPIVTEAEQAASQASVETPDADQQATPELEAALSRPDATPPRPTEQASPSEAEAPDLRMAPERTAETSEAAPEAVQATDTTQAQVQAVQAAASVQADAQRGEQRNERAAAPEHGNASDTERRIEAWQRAIFAHIARFKTYPEEARKRHVRGEVIVVFRLDRDGQVSEARVVTGSGAAILDQAAVAVLGRASPLPRPPTELGGGFLELQLPLQYRLR